jgi:hypothetical protein
MGCGAGMDVLEMTKIASLYRDSNPGLPSPLPTHCTGPGFFFSFLEINVTILGEGKWEDAV